MSEGQEVLDLRIELDLISVGKLASKIEAMGGRVVWCRVATPVEKEDTDVE